MKVISKKLPGSQKGSFYSTAIIVVMFGVLLTAGLKIAPAYMDDNVIVNAMEGVAANNNLADMTVTEIRSGVMRTLQTNNVDFDASNIVVVRDGSKEYVDINYESRVHLFYNIGAVVNFEHRFDKN